MSQSHDNHTPELGASRHLFTLFQVQIKEPGIDWINTSLFDTGEAAFFETTPAAAWRYYRQIYESQ